MVTIQVPNLINFVADIFNHSDSSAEEGDSQLLLPPKSPFPLSSFCLFPLFFFEIFVVIYPSPSFILLLHLLVIHAHT